MDAGGAGELEDLVGRTVLHPPRAAAQEDGSEAIAAETGRTRARWLGRTSPGDAWGLGGAGPRFADLGKRGEGELT